MIKDRGNKKWVSLMIPELREGLEQFFGEEIDERPVIDEQRIEELERLLTQAWKTGRQVVIRYWEDDRDREITGQILWYEMGKIRLACEGGKVHIDVNWILDVAPA